MLLPNKSEPDSQSSCLRSCNEDNSERRAPRLGVLSKYLHLLQIGVENILVYRMNFFCRAIFNLIPLFAIITLWRAVYSGSGSSTIAGYTAAQMISYYLLVVIIDALTSVTEDDWQIAADIKDGHINQFLVRPVDYMSYRLCLFVSGRIVFTLAAAGPLLLFVLSQREYFLWPAHTVSLVCFLVSLALSALLQFFISFVLATLAFRVLEISSFVFVLLAFQRLLGGQMFPLDILPAPVQNVLLFSPFACQTFIPASIYLERVPVNAMGEALLIQASWVLLAWMLARFCWSRGLRSYSAVGG
jgi:ABC-2 type transport system permease protein